MSKCRLHCQFIIYYACTSITKLCGISVETGSCKDVASEVAPRDCMDLDKLDNEEEDPISSLFLHLDTSTYGRPIWSISCDMHAIQR